MPIDRAGRLLACVLVLVTVLASGCSESAPERPETAAAPPAEPVRPAPDEVAPGALDPAEPVVTQHWPAFRGVRNSGVSDSARPVLEWDLESGRNVRWSTPIPGYSHSSPVVWGERAFVTTAIATDPSVEGRRDGVGNNAIEDDVAREWRIYAVDREDGRVLWERTAHRGAPRVARHEKGTHANPTPATDGTRVVALFNSEGLDCWSVDGELLWSRDLGRLDPGYWGQPDNNWGHAASPVLFEDLVIVQSDDFADSFLAAYRLADGSEAWRVPRDELATWATPLIHGEGDDAILVAQGGNHVRAYHPRTGEELWSFADHAEVKVPSPIAYRGLLVLSGGAPSGRPVFALEVEPPGGADRGTGVPPGRWTIDSGGPYTPTPLAYGDLLYVARDAGILSVYELASGDLVYRERLGTGFSASPVAAEGRLYLASEDGDVYVVAAGREFELLAHNTMGEPLFATPALTEDLLLVRTRTRLVGLGAF